MFTRLLLILIVSYAFFGSQTVNAAPATEDTPLEPSTSYKKAKKEAKSGNVKQTANGSKKAKKQEKLTNSSSGRAKGARR